MKIHLKILLILLLFINSCNYTIGVEKDDNGKRHYFRSYKNYKDQIAYNDKKVFNNNYSPRKYKSYNNSIINHEIENWPYLQFDSVLIGFGPSARDLMDLFERGLLYSEIFYCAKDSSCNPPSKSISTELETGKIINREKEIWDGYVINVGEIIEPEYLKLNPKQRRFKLWVSLTYGGHGYDIFFIELKNDTVTEYIDIKEFVKNAELTFIFYPWSEI